MMHPDNKRYLTRIPGAGLVLVLLFSLFHCTKFEPQGFLHVNTGTVSAITDISVQAGGEVTDDGGEEVSERGVCWGTSANPTLSDNKHSGGSGTGSFTSMVTGLQPNTSYFLRAYATNSTGTTYGKDVTFTTLEEQVTNTFPTVSTLAVTGITENSAVSGGEVSDEGLSSVTSRGVCWATSSGPTIADDTTLNGSGAGAFTSLLSGLEAGTTYFTRAYATNSHGTSYGEERSFSTQAAGTLPSVSTSSVTEITDTSAVSGGEVSNDGGSPVTARGVCWGTSSGPTVSNDTTINGNGTGSFASQLSGLQASTTYYVRAYAENGEGIAYGSEESFTTHAAGTLATVTTTAVSGITENSAWSGGNVTADGGSTVTERGVCWSTSQTPTTSDYTGSNGSGTGSYSVELTGLEADTKYYVRAYAINNEGTAYGGEESFTTAAPSTVTDIDGNVYQTIQIGDQLWMAENLRVTRYPNEDVINYVYNESDWFNLENYSEAYCYYDNSTSNRDLYGNVYTWAAATNGAASSNSNPSGVQGVCPDGWHLPSDAEWMELELYLGMDQATANLTNFRGSNEGGKLKEAGTTHWASPNAGATNETGFTALPGGFRNWDGPFVGEGLNTIWWSSTASSSNSAYNRGLNKDREDIYRVVDNKTSGFYIRCVKD
jgi:uncharacterized protein (TIGR02145 family)